jgi:hypothetical protein
MASATVTKTRKQRNVMDRPEIERSKLGQGEVSRSKLATPGRFGAYGGRYVPETLMAALDELEREYEKAKSDPANFSRRLADLLLKNYASRGAKIYLKREDLLHTGAHKINNCIGQALLARTHGQAPHHRRNRRGPARRCHGHRLRAASAWSASSTWAPRTCGGRS